MVVGETNLQGEGSMGPFRNADRAFGQIIEPMEQQMGSDKVNIVSALNSLKLSDSQERPNELYFSEGRAAAKVAAN